MFAIKRFILLPLVILAASTNSHDWTLDAQSSVVSFISIKKNNIGETHRFTDISGAIDGAAARVSIKADSVDTKVPIRDERMREFLFRTGTYPTIDISAAVGDLLQGMTAGSSKVIAIPASLSLHGVVQEIELRVRVSLLNDSTLTVTSTQPVLISAAKFGMVEGITKLASLVNKLSIAESVPVSFSLTFKN